MLTYSLTSRERLEQLTPSQPLLVEPVRVANPMSNEQEHLRTSLRGSILEVVARNLRREQSPVRVFELSRVYLPQGDELPDERETLCALLCGSEESSSWHPGERPVDFYEAKGLAEFVLAKSGVEARYVPGADRGLFPGRQAEVLVAGEKVGVVGQLHPAVAQSFEVSGDVFIVELDVARLMAHSQPHVEYQPLSRFPFSERDLAIVVDETVTYDSVADIMRSFPLVSRMSLFDVYTGEQIPRGKKSFAIRLVYQASDRTLTDSQVNEVQNRLLAKLQAGVGAVLRS